MGIFTQNQFLTNSIGTYCFFRVTQKQITVDNFQMFKILEFSKHNTILKIFDDIQTFYGYIFDIFY